MDIKLRARLSAYSKVDSINTGCCSGDPITKEHIDSLFTDTVFYIIIVILYHRKELSEKVCLILISPH